MCLSSSTKSPVDNHLRVYVMKVLEMRALRCSYVYLCMRDKKPGIGVCVPSSLSSVQLLVCACMYTYVNTAEQLQLHKAVVLLLKYEVFCIKNSLVLSYNYTMQPYH